jgi:hypothetical protein
MGKCKVHGDHESMADTAQTKGYVRGSEYTKWLERAGVHVDVQQGPHFALTVAASLEVLARQAPCKSSARGMRAIIEQLVEPFDDIVVNNVCVGATIRETIASAYEPFTLPTIPEPEIVSHESIGAVLLMSGVGPGGAVNLMGAAETTAPQTGN